MVAVLDSQLHWCQQRNWDSFDWKKICWSEFKRFQHGSPCRTAAVPGFAHSIVPSPVFREHGCDLIVHIVLIIGVTIIFNCLTTILVLLITTINLIVVLLFPLLTAAAARRVQRVSVWAFAGGLASKRTQVSRDCNENISPTAGPRADLVNPLVSPSSSSSPPVCDSTTRFSPFSIIARAWGSSEAWKQNNLE